MRREGGSGNGQVLGRGSAGKWSGAGKIGSENMKRPPQREAVPGASSSVRLAPCCESLSRRSRAGEASAVVRRLGHGWLRGMERTQCGCSWCVGRREGELANRGSRGGLRAGEGTAQASRGWRSAVRWVRLARIRWRAEEGDRNHRWGSGDNNNLSRLTVFNLADNQISGEIPPSLPGLASLMHLDLSNNRITEEIPGNFGDLRKLSRALLAGNQITGGIPGSIGSMNRLADLDLSGNRIRGTIPEGLGRMQVLSTLYLDGNQLSGEIPASLLSSRGISILNLSKNSLEGGIPDVFGDGSYFTALDLSYNRLRGSVPETLKTAKFVGHLDLSHNQLCGHIPQGEPFDHLEAASFSGNDCLCGGPLPRCLSHH
ncbi:hypothetical protein Taro_048140 [Colocasia esculenta]|uniref:Uncharacterized protein n=1 Tax=Colocasia esculenta TaxID=4460 RepID=A0A843X844_COLES|nr:hypothetical protein [Colocasia esculenta]